MLDSLLPINVNSEMSAPRLPRRRERTQNWNMQEKELLLELCRKEVNIIENKHYDARHTDAKCKVWEKIHNSFSERFGNERSVNRLKEQWRRMKAAARAEMMEYKGNLNQFGTEMETIKKPSEFNYKICALLDEAHRTSELENTNFTEQIGNPKTLVEIAQEAKKVLDQCTKSESNENQANEIKEQSKKFHKQLHIRKTDKDEKEYEPLLKRICCPSNNKNMKSNLESEISSDENSSNGSNTCTEDDVAESIKLKDTSLALVPKIPIKLSLREMQAKEHQLRMKSLELNVYYVQRANELLDICKDTLLQANALARENRG